MREYFGVIDFLVFFGTLAISFSIGMFFAILDRVKKRNSPDDYFLAGRNSSMFPVALSFIVTFQSSLLILATPVEVYAYSMMFCYNVVGITLSYIFAGLVIVPVFYPLKITSVNKYFYLRYGDNLVRYLVVFTGVVYNIFYMGTVIYGTCVAAEVVMGIPYWGTVLIYTVVTSIYTSIGGIKAVIWTDVFQLIIMLLGIIAVLIKSTIEAGGTSRVAELARDQLYMGEFSFDPTVRYTFWNVSFGTFTMFLYICLTQAGIQRINSTPNIKAARQIYIISGPFYSLFFFMTAYEGVTIFAYHASKGCDIFNGGLIENVNEILPVTVIQLFKDVPGVTGLFIASLSSAALSTLSSCLSSLSAITYEDVIRVIYPDMEDTKATKLSKIVVLVYGFIAMATTFIISKIPGSVTNIFLGFMGCLDGPTTAVFMLSVFYKRGSSRGVFIGAVCGMAISFWLIMGKTFSSIPADSMLPSGPIDNCPIYANASYLSPHIRYKLSNQTNHVDVNISDIFGDIAKYRNSSFNQAGVTRFRNNTDDIRIEQDPGTNDLSLQEKIYTTSYVLFSLIGFIVSIIVSVIISVFTKAPDSVDDKYMFSFKKHIMEELFGRGPKAVPSLDDDVNNDSEEESNEMTNFKA